MPSMFRQEASGGVRAACECDTVLQAGHQAVVCRVPQALTECLVDDGTGLLRQLIHLLLCQALA